MSHVHVQLSMSLPPFSHLHVHVCVCVCVAPKRISKIEAEMERLEAALAKIDDEMMAKGSDLAALQDLQVSPSCPCLRHTPHLHSRHLSHPQALARGGVDISRLISCLAGMAHLSCLTLTGLCLLLVSMPA